MKKKIKLQVEELSVQSFVTSVKAEQTKQLKAGGSLENCIQWYSTLRIVCGSC